ncbi:serine hydrolase [Streptomyces sp. NPDC005955]|uniref:serine hydrolase n=1 Tax=Streptomyces sp. NPDC005955 TaxID=3364738 RepID=UPI0036BAF585
MFLRSPNPARTSTPSPRPVVLSTFVGSLLVVLLGCSSPGHTRPGSGGPPGSGAPASSPSLSAPSTAPSPSTAASTSPSARPEETTVEQEERLARALEPVRTRGKSRYSVALAPLDGDGAPVSYRGTTGFATASIVKVDILAALLLGAQRSGRRLTPGERGNATAMIERSDNASASALWTAIGGARGLDAANERLGLTGTTGGAAGRWGLTRTTAVDQVALLRAVFDAPGGSALSAASRAYVQQLMGRVVSGQDWGVSAAGGPEHALKNGWLPRSATGLWVINSVGRVSVEGRSYLVAVLSDGHTSMDEGVQLVEKVASLAVEVLEDGAGADGSGADGAAADGSRAAPVPSAP